VKVGAILMSQNSESFLLDTEGKSDAHANSSQFYRDEIQTGALAMELGFDGVWCVEHHFTAHGETPAPLQNLTFFTGRYPQANLGTCVIVLPWNDPVRVAEQLSILDNLMPPESVLRIGLGRGSARTEFAGFEVALSESNDRFTENWEIIKALLTEEHVTYNGKWRSVTDMTLLPRPRSKDLLSKIYYSWGSKGSLRLAADAGFSPLFVPRGTVEEYREEMVDFNAIRAEHGLAPSRPILCLNVFTDEDSSYAQENGRKYLRNFYSNSLDHYEKLEPEHYRAAGNYADAVATAETLAKRDRDELLDELADIQIFGTPAEVLEKLRHWHDVMGPELFAFSMRFGGMPWDVAERNIRAISKLLPEIDSWTNPPLS
jgi:alkanesulfonate monooxygenase SsuD/methylene tetrahydromethanopterin reductase-like flavin-dependent oxidoreductase (luciferase family)